MFTQINKPKPKYKDTEGLGFKVPVENIAGLATSIGIAALTGGASIATEAGIAGAQEGLVARGLRGAASGALRGVAAAGNSIKTATIAGGVSGAVNHVLGGGTVGNIVGGVVGGLASRGTSGALGGAVSSAVGSVSNRISGGGSRSRVRPINEDTHPLLPNRAFSGQGNRAEGNRTVSRLISREPHEPQI